MAYARDGIGGRVAGFSGGLAVGPRLRVINQTIRVELSHHQHLEPGCRAFWRAAIYLRHYRFLSDRSHHRSTAEHRDRCIPNRTCTAPHSATTRFAHRNAGGDPERDPRSLGNFRNGPMVTRLPVRISETNARLDSIL